MSEIIKTRNYATVVYPESAPEDWLDILEMSFVPAFVSPLHDSDVDKDGSLKKPHYHVQIFFDNTKTVAHAKKLFDSFGGVGCIPLASAIGYARYLCHLDSPNKTRYDVNDVRCFGGKDYISFIETTRNDLEILKEIQLFISDCKISSFADLSDYAMCNRDDWFVVIATKFSYYLDKYIKSKTWTNRMKGENNNA